MRFAPLLAAVALMAATQSSHAQWKPAPSPLMTPWAEKIDPNQPLPEYPRPQLVREQWSNLNGLWDYVIADHRAAWPETYEGQILVPFAIESALSGVGKTVNADQALWYKRTFTTPLPTDGGRTLLHFGGVDWRATVYVNGKLVADHRGGHTPFTADITTALKSAGDNELVVRVYDPTDADSQPRGKQIRNPHGIWYTPVTGIWQTVWLENVPAISVEKLKLTPDVDTGVLNIDVTAAGTGDAVDVEITAKDGSTTVGTINGKTGATLKLPVPNAKLWSPDSPHLYDLTVTIKKDGKTIDTVESYFAMRKLSLGKDKAGYVRMLLNDKAVFQFGPLDQGWWPDGLYTAPTDEALKFDLEVEKQYGFNMVRKHIKIEPARWYYHCDKLGLLVWQDMPSGMGEGKNQGIGPGSKNDALFRPIERAQWHDELKEMMDVLHNHPSIAVWVPFNEGWGQHETNTVLKWTKAYDPSRFVDGPTGWEDRGYGDMHDMHAYPGPSMFPLQEGRAAVLGEYGGLGLIVPGHIWQDDKNWGYRSYKDKESLTEAYLGLTDRLAALAQRGLSAAVYTQTTDVEIEVNGFLTYDRKVFKLDTKVIADAHAKVYEAANTPVKVKEVVPSSQHAPQTYRFTTDKPADGWEKQDFDASAWKEAAGGFGREGTPGAVIGTQWHTDDIWLRRIVKLDAKPEGTLSLNLHHDDDTVVYINGILALKVDGATNRHTEFPIRKEALDALKVGDNVIAIHCHQRGGGQYIDFGFSIAEEVK